MEKSSAIAQRREDLERFEFMMGSNEGASRFRSICSPMP